MSGRCNSDENPDRNVTQQHLLRACIEVLALAFFTARPCPEMCPKQCPVLEVANVVAALDEFFF